MKEKDMAELCCKYRKNIANLCITEGKMLDDSNHPTAVSMTLDNGDKVIYIPHEEPERISIGDVVKVVENPKGQYKEYAGQKGVVLSCHSIPCSNLNCFIVLMKDGTVISFLKCAVVKDKGSFDIQWMLDRI